MNPPPPQNSPAPPSPVPSRLWPGLALALFVVGMMIAIPNVLAGAPPALERISRETNRDTFNAFFKVRMWVSFAAQFVFAAGLMACAGIVRGGWGIRRLSLLGFGFGIVGCIMALIVVNLLDDPKQARPLRSFDIRNWIWLAQVFLRTGAVVALALTLRGWVRWAGLAIGAVALVLLLGDWVFFMARKYEVIQSFSWERWGRWALGFAGVVAGYVGVLFCTAMVLFKPALASDGPAASAR